MLHKIIAATKCQIDGYAPVPVPISPRYIGWVIGTRGERIKNIVQDFGIRHIHIDVEKSVAEIYGDPLRVQLARTYLKAITHDIRIGDELTARVTDISDFAVYFEIHTTCLLLHCAVVPHERFTSIKQGDILRVRVSERALNGESFYTRLAGAKTAGTVGEDKEQCSIR